MRPTGVICALALGAAAAMAAAPARAQAHSLEYPVKAAFLYKFAPFVEWPPRAFDGDASPLTICIVGHDPFGSTLDQVVAGQKLNHHPIVARRIDTIAAASPCQIAYFGGSKAQSVAEGLAAVRGAPVLTVTDQSMGSARGAIHFVVHDNRVRFHIDDGAASRNGVTLSSKLMSLALTVKRRVRG